MVIRQRKEWLLVSKAMVFIAIFVIEIILLYFLSRRIAKQTSSLIFRITKSEKWTVWITSILFLPGTFLHELSHYLVAIALFIPVGEINFIPEFEKGEVRLGSIEVGKTDFVRRFIVGIAPVIVGLVVLFALLLWIVNFDNMSFWMMLASSYFVFVIGNTMFSSKKDMEGAWKLLTSLAVMGVLFYLLGVNIQLDPQGFLAGRFIEAVKMGIIFLAVPIIIDVLFIQLLSAA